MCNILQVLPRVSFLKSIIKLLKRHLYNLSHNFLHVNLVLRNMI